jgi:hypothetical protein
MKLDLVTIVFSYVVGFCILGLFFCKYLLYRNDKVRDFLVELILTDKQKYNQLSKNIYDKMLWHFWIWPLDKFLPKEK